MGRKKTVGLPKKLNNPFKVKNGNKRLKSHKKKVSASMYNVWLTGIMTVIVPLQKARCDLELLDKTFTDVQTLTSGNTTSPKVCV